MNLLFQQEKQTILYHHMTKFVNLNIFSCIDMDIDKYIKLRFQKFLEMS